MITCKTPRPADLTPATMAAQNRAFVRENRRSFRAATDYSATGVGLNPHAKCTTAAFAVFETIWTFRQLTRIKASGDAIWQPKFSREPRLR